MVVASNVEGGSFATTVAVSFATSFVTTSFSFFLDVDVWLMEGEAEMDSTEVLVSFLVDVIVVSFDPPGNEETARGPFESRRLVE
jgi:hypothetical protein